MAKDIKRHIQLLKSSGATAPAAADLLYGEIAVGYGKDNEALYIKNSNGDVVKEITTDTVRTVVSGLSYGTYTLGEEEAPDGYERITEPVTITISADSNSETLIDVNHKPVYAIKLYKLDDFILQN